jgi:hypothetical protein
VWRFRVGLRFVIGLLLAASLGLAQDRSLGKGERIAAGVELYRLTDPRLVDPPVPTAAYVLHLDLARVQLRSVHALDKVIGTETVLEMSRRRRALAAVNAGFFAPNGDPAGLLKIGGELISDTERPRGAVALSGPAARPQRLVFDRVTVQVATRFDTSEGVQVFAAASVDTIRQRDQLTVYTPRYHEDTGTPNGGVEWVLRGRPLKVVERRDGAGSTPIPRDGIVLSYGGPSPPDTLNRLAPGVVVQIIPQYKVLLGSELSVWQNAYDAVSGAGLLLHRGAIASDWKVEDLRAGFDTERHPRTMIGVDGSGNVWLVAVDGRQPGYSMGMTFKELQQLALRLRLRDALNLDGGGSTTMVVGDTIVNRPSDPQGPRMVSDALIVLPR